MWENIWHISRTQSASVMFNFIPSSRIINKVLSTVITQLRWRELIALDNRWIGNNPRLLCNVYVARNILQRNYLVFIRPSDRRDSSASSTVRVCAYFCLCLGGRKSSALACTQARSSQRWITQQPYEKRTMLENHPLLLLLPLHSVCVCLSVSGIHLSVVSAREWYTELSLLVSPYW